MLDLKNYTTSCKRWITLYFVLLFSLEVGAQGTFDSITIDKDSLFTPSSISKIDVDSTIFFDAPGASERTLVKKRQISDSILNQLYQDDAFWYANAKLNRQEKKMKGSYLSKLINQEWFKTFLWVIIIGSFSFIIMWFLIVSNKSLFRKKPISNGRAEMEMPIEDIFLMDFDTEIRKAVEAKNFRNAIRMMYLQTLKALSDKNIITYKQEKTNSEYVQQLWNSPYYLAFFRLTRHFEYAWYGHLTITEPSFEQVMADFTTFKQQL